MSDIAQSNAGARTRVRVSALFESPEAFWGMIFVLPYIVIFALFVVYPVAYGLWLGSDPSLYVQLFNDPIYLQTLYNTLLYLVIGVNLKLFLALLLAEFFVLQKRWINMLFLVFILPWAVPAIPEFISIHWMLNSQWGLINNILWQVFGSFGPPWLARTDLAFGSIITFYIWKWLPFWTLIFLAARLSIPKELYEAAAVDGATGPKAFFRITIPMVSGLYITCTLLSILWSLGDYNTVHFVTGGGPVQTTHVLATLGIRNAFTLGNPALGVATVITALPLIIPLVVLLMRQLHKQRTEL